MEELTMATMTDLKQTPLFNWHKKSGAKLVPFAGWEMPLQFTKVAEEHHAVRQAAGLFDIGHMGQIIVSADNQADALTFLNRLVPQDLTKLYPSKAFYTQFLNEAGGIIDDLIIYQLPETVSFPKFQQFLVICNASNTPKVLDWMTQHQPEKKVNLQLVSADYTLFALQGPKFTEVLARLGIDVDLLPKRFHIAAATVPEIKGDVLFCRTGYTGEDGVEIIVSNNQAVLLWERLIGAGEAVGLLPVGLAARDTLRLEAAYPLHGNDISEFETPLEAGLGWSVKLDQEADFIGKAALVKQKADGVTKKLYCLRFADKVIPRQHCKVLVNDAMAGEIASGSISLTLGYPIALAYIAAPQPLQPGESVSVEIRGKKIPATITKRPFYVQ